ncbi:MAG TPA: triphosphoribosyl-dephospho-CoA synthase [Vicinamibacterales bacterium]|nr:triphosphoribosyl-dephospho-CoA synthase [Vicinamibacterales bacterium]
MTLRDSGLGLPPPAATPDEIAAAAQLACLLEAHAPKPGNVSPGRDFADVGYGDFVASAAAIGAPFARVAGTPLGALVREAVDATSRWARSNTNLGIVLLLAPLAKAALGPNDLRSNLVGVLDATTVDDAREVYAAIRLASPGGLGRAANQDVAREPTLPLREVMRLAADRDSIAREYDTSFAATFDTGLPALRQARADGLGWDDAIVETFLTLLAAAPDTHIVRRAGLDRAVSVSRLAVTVLAEGGVRTDAGRQSVARFDRSLRDDRHSANPGTSADLTAAAIFVLLLEGGWGR